MSNVFVVLERRLDKERFMAVRKNRAAALDKASDIKPAVVLEVETGRGADEAEVNRWELS